VVIDRIIAVVGDTPLRLSDLRARLVPVLTARDQPKLSAEDRQKAERRLAGAQIQRMIDAELVAQAAARAQVDATQAEIDEALARVAAQNKISVPELFTSAAKMGMIPSAYRKEIAGQLRDNLHILFRRLSDQLRQAQVHELAQPSPPHGRLTYDRDHGDTHPERVQAGRVPVVRHGIQPDVDLPVQLQIRVARPRGLEPVQPPWEEQEHDQERDHGEEL
jgi:hypothetical protein